MNTPPSLARRTPACARRWLRWSLPLLALGLLGAAGAWRLSHRPVVASVVPLEAPALQPAAPTAGPLRIGTDNPRYFRNAAGQAVYLAGVHTWNSLQDIGPEDPPAKFDYTNYLALLQQHHLNFIRLWRWEVTRWTKPPLGPTLFCALHPWPRSGSKSALDGQPQFDLSRFNQAYFDRLRARVELAREHGIYVSIMLFEGSILRATPADWRYHPFNPANNTEAIDGSTPSGDQTFAYFTLTTPAVTRRQEAYVRKVIDTVNDLDNVLYEVCNENAWGGFAWEQHIINYIRAYEAGLPHQHPIGLSTNGGASRDDTGRLFGSSADWISPNALSRDYRTAPPPNDGAKIVIADTDHLWGIGGDPAWVWKSFVRGLNPILMDPYDGCVFSTQGDPSRWASIRTALGATARLAARADLATLTPRPELASTQYCLANPGHEYIVYAPAPADATGTSSSASLPFTVNVTAASGDFTAEWIDPVTARIHPAEPVRGGGVRSLTPPFPGDAVLHLRSLPAQDSPAAESATL